MHFLSIIHIETQLSRNLCTYLQTGQHIKHVKFDGLMLAALPEAAGSGEGPRVFQAGGATACDAAIR